MPMFLILKIKIPFWLIILPKSWYWLWHEGCSLDFLQKYIVDAWLYVYCVRTGFLINERFWHDQIIFFINDNILFFYNHTNQLLSLHITFFFIFIVNCGLFFLF